MAGNTGSMISPEGKALRDAVNTGEFRGITSWKLTSTRAGATGFGKFSTNNKVDVFKEAVNVGDGLPAGDSPYNTWLDENARPLFNVFPRHLGIYLGAGLSDGTMEFKRTFLERCIVRLISTRGTHIKQNALTLPSGFDLTEQQTDSGVYVERHGPPAPDKLFRLPDDLAFARATEKLQCILEIDKDLTTFLTANAGAVAGSFPAYGAVITVVVYGDAEYPLGARGV